jgi:hypothetical protein
MAYRIPVINQNERFLDINEEPLVNGKVEVLDPVSNNFLTIWSYADDEYTVMQNPVILDVEGRATQTVFCDRIVYCRVYAYKGLDENNRPIWEFIRDYYAGSNDNTESREYVVGIEDLKDLDPSINSSVNVLGYYNAFDCPMRQYVWDENCTQDPDGGYVIASDVQATGRWILVFSGEYLPSSYYGVYPGHVANINAFTSYVSKVGTNLIPTAPGIWFVPGEYNVETNVNTEKRVLLDCNTQFDCDYFFCGNLTVKGEPEVAICDFDFRDAEQEAHSSWFRTIAGFLTSGAKKYIFDAKDNFVNKVLQGSVTLSNKIIEGQTRLPVTYSGNGRITFSNCVINAERIFNSTDKISFAYTEIHDHWWINPADIDFYSNVSARSTAINTLVIDNFTNMTAFVNALGANGASTIDLAGREIYSLNLPTSVTELRNAHVTYHASISAAGRNITIRNCQLDNASITCNQLSVYNSRIYFNNEPSVSAAWFDNCEIIAGVQFTAKSNQYIFNDCTVSVSFKRVTDNDTRDAYLGFTRCAFENCAIESKTLVMKNCDCDGCTIKIYPYKDNNNVYRMYCYLSGNRFNSGSPIEFTKVDMINGSYQDNVYEIIVSWTITNNFFAGNTEGLRCRYWQHRTGSNYGKTFIAWSNDNAIVYKDNTGDCPDDNASQLSVTNGTGCEANFYWAQLSEDAWVTLVKSYPKRVMMNLKANTVAYHWNTEAINDNGFAVRTRYTGNDGGAFETGQGCWIYPWSHLMDNVENGDLFKAGFSKWGKLRENDPSYYPWTWRFLKV